MLFKYLGFLLLLFFTGCTESMVKRYADVIEPQLGSATKSDFRKLFGPPAFCKPDKDWELCEYRTAHTRNYPTPRMYAKNPTFGPDLSPYEFFDVIHLYYNEWGILQEWDPVVVSYFE